MILSKVYGKVRPPSGVDAFVGKLNALLSKSKVDAEAIAGGSYAKGTYLSNPDIDIFVRFDMGHKGKDISKILHDVLKPLKPVVIHGSRDYFQVGNFEIVPVLKISEVSEAVNITDVSFFHIEWVRKHIGKLQDDVRLAKLFCHSANIYGAESHINGFSGYILELLVIYYGGFDGLIKAVTGWGSKTVIDPAKHYSGRDPLKILNESKIQSPLVVVDPVMHDRNASASVNLESYSKFILAAKHYLKSPAREFFRHHDSGLFSAKKNSKLHGTKLLTIKVKPLEGKEDVIGSKLVKAFNYVKRQLELNEFRIFASGWGFDGFWFELYEDRLPRLKRHMGPPVWVRGADDFLKKHKDVMVENGVLVAIVKRSYPDARRLLKKLLKDKEVVERVKSAK